MTTSAEAVPQKEPAAIDLSKRQTGLSFQRTRMSADRTLMSVIRTALSLIGFGFTIFQFFRHLAATTALKTSGPAARNFSGSLVVLGVGMLTVGIIYHLQYMRGLRRLRASMTIDGSIHGESTFPVSFTLIVAVLLLLIGLAAAASIVFRSGPFV
jgi:putative membrane protein